MQNTLATAPRQAGTTCSHSFTRCCVLLFVPNPHKTQKNSKFFCSEQASDVKTEMNKILWVENNMSMKPSDGKHIKKTVFFAGHFLSL